VQASTQSTEHSDKFGKSETPGFLRRSAAVLRAAVRESGMSIGRISRLASVLGTVVRVMKADGDGAAAFQTASATC